MATARAAIFRNFVWQGGHADVWSVFADGGALASVVEGMAAPWRRHDITYVAGVESRGFLLGAPVAVQLGVGFLAVRKPGGMLPGRKLRATTRPDYRGFSHELRMQDVLGPGDKVLLVDDWAERGSQAQGVGELVNESGARFAGVALMVDQLTESTRATLGRVTCLVLAGELEERIHDGD